MEDINEKENLSLSGSFPPKDRAGTGSTPLLARPSCSSALKPVNNGSRLNQSLNSPSSKETPLSSPYKPIRLLDSAERWIERTSVVTKQDHNANLENAQAILLELINNLPLEHNNPWVSQSVKDKESVDAPRTKETPLDMDELANLLGGLDLDYTATPMKSKQEQTVEHPLEKRQEAGFNQSSKPITGKLESKLVLNTLSSKEECDESVPVKEANTLPPSATKELTNGKSSIETVSTDSNQFETLSTNITENDFNTAYFDKDVSGELPVETEKSETLDTVSLNYVEVGKPKTLDTDHINNIKTKNLVTVDTLPLKNVETEVSETMDTAPLKNDNEGIEILDIMPIHDIEIEKPVAMDTEPVAQAKNEKPETLDTMPVAKVESEKPETLDAELVSQVEGTNPETLYTASVAQVEIEKFEALHTVPLKDDETEKSEALNTESVAQVENKKFETLDTASVAQVEIEKSEALDTVPLKDVEIEKPETLDTMPTAHVEIEKPETFDVIPVKYVEIREHETLNTMPITHIEIENPEIFDTVSVSQVEIENPEIFDTVSVAQVEIENPEIFDTVSVAQVEIEKPETLVTVDENQAEKSISLESLSANLERVEKNDTIGFSPMNLDEMKQPKTIHDLSTNHTKTERIETSLLNFDTSVQLESLSTLPAINGAEKDVFKKLPDNTDETKNVDMLDTLNVNKMEKPESFNNSIQKPKDTQNSEASGSLFVRPAAPKNVEALDSLFAKPATPKNLEAIDSLFLKPKNPQKLNTLDKMPLKPEIVNTIETLKTPPVHSKINRAQETDKSCSFDGLNSIVEKVDKDSLNDGLPTNVEHSAPANTADGGEKVVKTHAVIADQQLNEVNQMVATDDAAAMDIQEDEFRPASEVFNDAAFFDMLEKADSSKLVNAKRESVLVKFDPLQARRESGLSKTRNQELLQRSLLQESRNCSPTDTSVCLFGTPPNVTRRRVSILNRQKARATSVCAIQEASEVDMIFAQDDNNTVDGILQENLFPSEEGQLLEIPVYTEAQMKQAKTQLTMEFQELILKKDSDFQKRLKEQEENYQELLNKVKAEAEEERSNRTEEAESYKKENQGLQEQLCVLRALVTTYEELVKQAEEAKDSTDGHLKEIMKSSKKLEQETKTWEESFGALYTRHEKLKEAMTKVEQNNQVLSKAVLEEQNRSKTILDSQAKMKESLQAKIDEVLASQSTQEGEIAKLQAAIKRKTIQIQGLESALEQKKSENKELTELCDTLISKAS